MHELELHLASGIGDQLAVRKQQGLLVRDTPAAVSVSSFGVQVYGIYACPLLVWTVFITVCGDVW